MDDDDYGCNTPDSLDREIAEHLGVIKVQNPHLLSQLVEPKTQVEKVCYPKRNTQRFDGYLDDAEDFHYVNSDVDEDLPDVVKRLPDTYGRPAGNKSLKVSRNSLPKQSKTISSIPKQRFVPPLQLTDSLIADDPTPDAARVVRDSLDSSIYDGDMDKQYFFLSSEHQKPTPNTLKELDISAGLAGSTTPKQSHHNSYLDDYNVSVASQYSGLAQTTPQPSAYSSGQVVSVKVKPSTYDMTESKAEGKSDGSLYKNNNQNTPLIKQNGSAQTQQSDSASNLSPKSDPGRKPGVSLGSVAPKPQRPEKDFIEKNKTQAKGVNSAKLSYADKLLVAKQQKEHMKNWAPGMVVPRKKAASADNALRSTEPEPHGSHGEQIAFPRDKISFGSDQNINTCTTIPVSKNSDIRTQNIATANFQVDSSIPLQSIVNGYPGMVANMKLIGPIPKETMHGVSYTSHDLNKPHAENLQSETTPGVIAGIPKSYSGSIMYQGRIAEKQTHQIYHAPSNWSNHSHGHEASYANYSDHYMMHQGDPSPYTQNLQAKSRWNSKKGSLPHELDITLDEVKALEENQAYGRSNSDLNPYQTVPPIKNNDDKQLVAIHAAQDSGYVHIHKSQKEKEERGDSYKQYTLEDYKKLNREIKLGGLGPSTDPAVIKQKHELRMKQLQYAKEARELEAKKASAKTKAAPNTKDQAPAIPNSRQLAKEYAKTVPKPKLQPKLVDEEETPLSPLKSSRSQNSLASTGRTPHSFQKYPDILADEINNYVTPNDIDSIYSNFSHFETIEMLHRRHLEEKQLVAALKQNI